MNVGKVDWLNNVHWWNVLPLRRVSVLKVNYSSEGGGGSDGYVGV